MTSHKTSPSVIREGNGVEIDYTKRIELLVPRAADCVNPVSCLPCWRPPHGRIFRVFQGDFTISIVPQSLPFFPVICIR